MPRPSRTALDIVNDIRAKKAEFAERSAAGLQAPKFVDAR
jgi:hypothetical protein